MSVIITLESNLDDRPIEMARVEKGDNIYYFHSAYAGQLIVARCMADTVGGEVYKADDDKWIGQDPTARDVISTINPGRLHKVLLPWFTNRLPTFLDNGDPATLTVQHIPTYTLISFVGQTNQEF